MTGDTIVWVAGLLIGGALLAWLITLLVGRRRAATSRRAHQAEADRQRRTATLAAELQPPRTSSVLPRAARPIPRASAPARREDWSADLVGGAYPYSASDPRSPYYSGYDASADAERGAGRGPDHSHGTYDPTPASPSTVQDGGSSGGGSGGSSYGGSSGSDSGGGYSGGSSGGGDSGGSSGGGGGGGGGE
jgi:uncharacterized membrane protein YgcG